MDRIETPPSPTGEDFESGQPEFERWGAEPKPEFPEFEETLLLLLRQHHMADVAGELVRGQIEQAIVPEPADLLLKADEAQRQTDAELIARQRRKLGLPD